MNGTFFEQKLVTQNQLPGKEHPPSREGPILVHLEAGSSREGLGGPLCPFGGQLKS